jgi:hypothetical protein
MPSYLQRREPRWTCMLQEHVILDQKPQISTDSMKRIPEESYLRKMLCLMKMLRFPKFLTLRKGAKEDLREHLIYWLDPRVLAVRGSHQRSSMKTVQVAGGRLNSPNRQQ